MKLIRGLPLLFVSVAAAGAVPGPDGDGHLACTYVGYREHCHAEICFGDSTGYIGDVPYKLMLDFKKKKAVLNGIHGRIYQPTPGTATFVVWDIKAFGRQEIIRDVETNGTDVRLRTDEMDIYFDCSNRVPRHSHNRLSGQ